MTDKKCAIITGLAAGVGAAVALELGERGYNVLINYNKSESEAEQTQAAVDKAGGNAIVVQGDVADDAACVAMAKAAMSEWGRLDVLVNNAGMTSFTGVDNWEALSNDVFSSMGHLGDIEHAHVQKTIREAVERLATIGVASPTLAFDPAVAERYVGYGYQMVCVGSDQSCLMVG